MTLAGSQQDDPQDHGRIMAGSLAGSQQEDSRRQDANPKTNRKWYRLGRFRQSMRRQPWTQSCCTGAKNCGAGRGPHSCAVVAAPSAATRGGHHGSTICCRRNPMKIFTEDPSTHQPPRPPPQLRRCAGSTLPPMPRAPTAAFRWSRSLGCRSQRWRRTHSIQSPLRAVKIMRAPRCRQSPMGNQ